jgi:transposase-like protein
MIFGYLMLLIAIMISSVAAYYSVAGLTAIFSASVLPVIIMGGALEAGKIAATVWLHNNWERAGAAYKLYLVPAIAFLMLLTSMGIFGFLSKAHNDQNLITGDVQSRISIYDEKIKTAKENIESDRKQLKQMDEAVDQVMGRSSDERGAERANAIRKSQQRDRTNLAQDIEASQKTIGRLNDEAAPIRAENRKVEAEVGPVKYIAAFIYGSNPDSSLLERAVTWVIILIVIVFDPLALCLILAANKQLEWARQGVGGWTHDKPAVWTQDAVDHIGKHIKPVEPVVEELAVEEQPDPETEQEEALEQFFIRAQLVARALDAEEDQRLTHEANARLSIMDPAEQDLDSVVEEIQEIQVAEYKQQQALAALAEEYDRAVAENTQLREWVNQLETDLRAAILLAQQATVTQELEPEIAAEPEHTPKPHNDGIHYKGKAYSIEAFNALHPGLVANNSEESIPEEIPAAGFGTEFPKDQKKGDMFLRVDYLPSRLFKWNGIKWIETDKSMTDAYAHDEAYIRLLADKLQSGEYDLEDLTDAEQAQVAEYLSRTDAQ